jgi:hypothetical protein
MSRVFLDTSYVVALSSITDANHDDAVEISEKIEQNNIKMVTTQGIVLEIGNSLARQRYRNAAVQIIEALFYDPNVEIVPLTEEWIQAGFELYQSRIDKEWGLVDCISFCVMENYGIQEALTADKHFIQAGFRALLKTL